MFTAIIILLVLFTLLQIKRKLSKPAPGPLGIPFIGSLSFVLNTMRNRSTVDLMLKNVLIYGDVYHLEVLGKDIVFVNSAEDVKFFMEKKFSSFVRGKERREELDELLGDGIFTADGEVWKFHRRMAKPIFSESYLFEVMYPTFVEEVQQYLLPRFQEAEKSGEAIDLFDVFTNFTIRTFLNVGLGAKISDEDIALFNTNFSYILSVVSGRGSRPMWRKLDPFDKLNEARDQIYKIIDRAIEENIEIEGKINIIANFMNGDDTTHQEVRDAFLNFMIAGRDTTAACASWSIFTYLTSQDETLKKSVLDHAAEFSLESTPEETSDMIYIKNYIKEILRLYPSVIADARRCEHEETLPSGVKMYPGNVILYSQYVSGRTKWENPMKIDPDRWLDEANMEPYNYTAFHGGPQLCLGRKMALLEVTVMISAVLNNFDLTLLDTSERVVQLEIITSPTVPLLCTVKSK